MIALNVRIMNFNNYIYLEGSDHDNDLKSTQADNRDS